MDINVILAGLGILVAVVIGLWQIYLAYKQTPQFSKVSQRIQSATVHQITTQPEVILDKYEVLRLITDNPMSKTHLARNRQDGHLYLLKQIKNVESYDSIMIEKVRAAYQRYQYLQRVALPIETVPAGDQLYEILEVIDGWTLDEIIRLNHDKGVYGQLLEDWAKDILDLLKPLHIADLVHRDISPYNVLLTRDKLDLALLDFSNVVDLRKRKKFMTIETPGFTALEIRDGRYSPSADIYSVGALLVYLNSGQAPPTIEDRLYRRKSFSLKYVRGRRLEPAIHRMMSLNPEERFQNAGETLEAIQRRGSTEVWNPTVLAVLDLPDGSKISMGLQQWERIQSK